ncbi:MAG: hypothetical protein ABSF77_13585 [Spirochaetia bacterium]|jgi:hypothetical protein
MRSRCLPLALAFLLAVISGAAADGVDPVPLLGLDLKAATDIFGLPQSMFAFRGTEEARDDVVFYYPDHLYLFWYKDRVWQVRMDRRYDDSVLGLTLGMPRDQAEKLSPQPVIADGDSSYFDLDSGSFPIRVRLVFTQNVLSDVYVYRSDF